jgi:protocatechuate 3,4-dioxygenase beta subunit
MKRKEFLKRGLLSALGSSFILPMVGACSKDTVDPATEPDLTTGTNGTCTTTVSETAGPFPTKTPGSLVLTDITSGRSGTNLTVKIVIQNKNNSCAALANAIVDIWHCDADGSYSEYGGSGMQSTNYTNVHFLRGRQTTDATGLVTFTSIYPGWYSGRAPHIHAHIYNSAGTSLLVTQIAFDQNISNTVYAQGVYKSHGLQDTTNARDNVFSDGVGTELASFTGSVANGYVLTHTIVVNG